MFAFGRSSRPLGVGFVLSSLISRAALHSAGMSPWIRTFLLLILSSSVVLAAEEKLNILWLIAEDLGPELACYGTKEVWTPNIDKLAQEGVRFIGCRTTGIYCFPSCHHARRIRPENRVPLASARQAASAGYRPCLGCRPASLAS